MFDDSLAKSEETRDLTKDLSEREAQVNAEGQTAYARI
jgi:hypothetical protein